MTRPRITAAERIRILEEQNARLVEKVERHKASIRELHQELGYTENLPADHLAVVRRYLRELDTLALLESANKAIRYDVVRTGGTTEAPIPDAAPVWAHNRLVHEIDHLSERADSIAQFTRSPVEVRQLRPRCRACHRPVDHTWPRHCAWCGETIDGGIFKVV